MEQQSIDGEQQPQSEERLSSRPVISGIELLEIAGVGGMGTVYKARQVAFDRLVAVKILHRHLLRDSTAVQRFAMEAKLATNLSHPNIVSVLSFGKSDDSAGQPYLIMDYLVGTSFKEYLEQKGVLKKAECVEFFSQICSALEHAHSVGVVHRDLKPGNVWLVGDASQSRAVKVLDFGIAKVVAGDESAGAQKLTQTGVVIGSPFYMSPEQCIGGTVDARSDLYSLGCMLFEALSGKPPFEGESLLDTMSKHLSQPTPPLRDSQGKPIDAHLESVIFRALEKQPAARYQTALDFLSDLRAGGSLKTKLASSSRIAAVVPSATNDQPLVSGYLSVPKGRSKAPLVITTVSVVMLALGFFVVPEMLHQPQITRAEKLMDSGNFNAARDILLSQLNQFGLPTSQQRTIIRMLEDLAVIYFEDGDVQTANSLLEKTSSFATDHSLHAEFVDSQTLVATFLVADFRKLSASTTILHSIAPAESGTDSIAALALIYRQLCVNQINTNPNDHSLLELEPKLLELARRSGRPDRLLTALLQHAYYEEVQHGRFREDYDPVKANEAQRAENLDFEQALATVESVRQQNTREGASGLAKLAMKLQDNSDPRACPLELQALEMYKGRRPSHWSMMELYEHIAQHFAMIRDNRERLAWLRLAADEAKHTADSLRRMNVLKDAGETEYACGDPATGLAYLNSALEAPVAQSILYVRVNAMVSHALILRRLGKFELSSAELKQVVVLCNHALKIRGVTDSSAPVREQWLQVLGFRSALGLAYLSLGQDAQAKQIYEDILRMCQLDAQLHPGRNHPLEQRMAYDHLLEIARRNHDQFPDAGLIKMGISTWQKSSAGAH